MTTTHRRALPQKTLERLLACSCQSLPAFSGTGRRGGLRFAPLLNWRPTAPLCTTILSRILAVLFAGLLAGLFFCAADVAHAQGLLGLLRDEVRTGDSSSQSGGDSDSDSDQRKRDNDRRSGSSGSSSNRGQSSLSNSGNGAVEETPWPGEEFVGQLVLAGAVGTFKVMSAPFWGPPIWLADQTPTCAEFAPYPYYHDLGGYLRIDSTTDGDFKPWGGRLRLEYGDDFDALSRIGGQLQIDTTSRFGFDTESNYRWENLGGGRHDQLWTGDANVLYRFAQNERATFHAGLGFNWMADRVRDDFGVNLTYKADFYPVRPLVVATEFDLGSLGHEFMIHARATAGVQMKRAETYIGYDWFDVGRFSNGGLVAGLRWSF